MKEQEEQIYQLAIHYFEGSISLADEEVLFRYVHADPVHYELYRRWEKDWMLSSASTPEIRNEWKHLQRRLQLRNSVSGFFHPHSYNLKRFVSIAAIITLLLVSGAYGLFSYYRQSAQNNFFALETAYGEKSKIILTDGTVVYLNAGSTLQYPDRFNPKNREVTLKGEAYFEVQRQKNNTPFLVKTAHYNILVKGTKFNVACYADDAVSTTTLLEGSIDILYQGKHLPVRPGESFSYDKKKNQYTCHRVQATQYKSWIEGRVEYDEITLKELAIRLSRKYDVHIYLDDQLDEDVKFRVSLRNEETITEVLQALTEIIPIRFDRNEREIHIRKQ